MIIKKTNKSLVLLRLKTKRDSVNFWMIQGGISDMSGT